MQGLMQGLMHTIESVTHQGCIAAQ